MSDVLNCVFVRKERERKIKKKKKRLRIRNGYSLFLNIGKKKNQIEMIRIYEFK
jgi:hypothetical protein